MDDLSKHAWLKELRVAHDLGDRHFRLLVILSTYADGDLDSAWPSRQTLAQCLGCSVRTVTNLMQKLEAGGYVVALHNRGGRANEWRLTFASEREPGNSGLPGSPVQPSNPGLPGSSTQPGNFGPQPGNFGAEPSNPGLPTTNYQFTRRARERPSGRARDAVDADAPRCGVCGKLEPSCRAAAAKTGDPHGFTPRKEAR